MSPKLKTIFSWVRNIGFTLFIVIILLLIYFNSTGKQFSVGGYQVLRVLTKSMEPTICDNTIIIIKTPDLDNLKEGDIITFFSDDPAIKGYLNTHRIHHFMEENGETLIITKGDSNSACDAYPVHKNQVKGLFIKELPGGQTIGAALVTLSDSKVYFICVMLPLIICLMSYIWEIYSLLSTPSEEELELMKEIQENEEKEQ